MCKQQLVAVMIFFGIIGMQYTAIAQTHDLHNDQIKK
jgi:hypothetical protein